MILCNGSGSLEEDCGDGLPEELRVCEQPLEPPPQARRRREVGDSPGDQTDESSLSAQEEEVDRAIVPPARHEPSPGPGPANPSQLLRADLRGPRHINFGGLTTEAAQRWVYGLVAGSGGLGFLS
jgi:hypothetical protein